MRRPRAVLHHSRVAPLRAALAALEGSELPAARIAHDPLAFPHRYDAPDDAEIASVFASSLAFGRVNAFWPVIDAVLAQADARGGPAKWIRGFNSDDAQALAPLRYRWLVGADLSLLARTLQVHLTRYPTIGAAFERGWRPSHADVEQALTAGISSLRESACVAAGDGATPARWDSLARGFRTCLSSPSSGSACKRWCMMLRWMCRPADGVDLGLWALPTRALVIPLDTHVLRTSQMLGLTHRTDGSFATAREITRNLRRISPDDPVRHDFALAHLGISGSCRGTHIPTLCGPCALAPLCRHGGG